MDNWHPLCSGSFGVIIEIFLLFKFKIRYSKYPVSCMETLFKKIREKLIRYETFEQALILHDFLVKTYTDYGYSIIETPFGTVEERLNFILNHLNQSE